MTATRWKDLIVYDDAGRASGTLSDMIDIAPANLDDAVIEDGKLTEWANWFVGIDGEDYDAESVDDPRIDWTGFEEALRLAREQR